MALGTCLYGLSISPRQYSVVNSQFKFRQFRGILTFKRIPHLIGYYWDGPLTHLAKLFIVCQCGIKDEQGPICSDALLLLSKAYMCHSTVNEYLGGR